MGPSISVGHPLVMSLHSMAGFWVIALQVWLRWLSSIVRRMVWMEAFGRVALLLRWTRPDIFTLLRATEHSTLTKEMSIGETVFLSSTAHSAFKITSLLPIS